jgi:hypothetical protein
MVINPFKLTYTSFEAGSGALTPGNPVSLFGPLVSGGGMGAAGDLTGLAKIFFFARFFFGLVSSSSDVDSESDWSNPSCSPRNAKSMLGFRVQHK